MSRFDLSGEIAVVIGGTGVLGGHIAVGFGEAGADVVVMGRRAEAGAERVAEIEAVGGKATYVRCDAADPASVAEAHAETRDRVGEVSVLLNAAGGNSPSVTVTDDHPFEAIYLDAWHDNFALNFDAGILHPCREFGPAMVANGRGSIINIASVTSHLPLSRVVTYSAAKAAVLSLSRFLAREWADKGVRVNTLTPGFFPAEQNMQFLFNEDGSPTDRTKSILGHLPMDRLGKPEELVGAAIFLAAEKASSYVTGSDIVVDGGFLAMTI
ncbi:D-mannonate oxidoreductase [Candidatus Poribacteria bacterium]|nr:D-mannonate oxidoreductase [Candidatus Poribacteria bacterium]